MKVGSSLVLLVALLSACAESSLCAVGTVQEADRCVPICTEPCGEHQACVTTETEASCGCAAGYEGDPCAWGGLPLDPDFTDPEAWSDTKNDAQVLPLAAGLTGPGIARFVSTVVCNAGAVAQVVEMPPYELAEPFVIELTYRAEGVNGVAVGYNRAFRTFPNTKGEWETRRVCMGAAGYGGPVKFQVAASERTLDCFTQPQGFIEVDRFEVLVAEPGDCPEPGTVLNGEADVDGGGWFFDLSDALRGDPGDGVLGGSLAAGAGNGESSGARVYKEGDGSNRAAMGTKFSVPMPTSMPSPALRFWWRGTSGHPARVEIGTFESVEVSTSGFDSLIADGEAHTYTYCLPPWAHGNTLEIAFAPVLAGDFVTANSELIVDDIELFSDSRCGDHEDLLDPHFDAAPNRWPHTRIVRAAADSVSLLNDPELSRSEGDGVLSITYDTNQAAVAVGTRLWVPPPEGERGPQAVFYSDVPADAPGPVRWVIGLTGTVRSELTPGGGWTRNEVCLPPEWAERWYRLGVSVNNFETPLVTYDEPTTVLIDDFELRTHESCRAH